VSNSYSCNILRLFPNTIQWNGLVGQFCDFQDTSDFFRSNFTNDLESCKNWCFNTIGWTAYVYQTNTLHCFTKIGKLESPAALYVPDPTSFCGVLNLNYNEINWNGNNYAAFCDHPGSDIQNYTNIMSAENCSTLCVNNPLCTHIVYRPTVHQKYITPVNNLCFLKGFFKRWECFTS